MFLFDYLLAAVSVAVHLPSHCWREDESTFTSDA
jgi:hypothetical protein